MWRLWVVTTWSTNLFDPGWPVVQPVVIGTMLAGVDRAAAFPQAFGKYGLIFAGAFVAVQVGRELFTVAAVRDSETHPVSERACCGPSCPPCHGSPGHSRTRPRAALWTLAVGVDDAALALAFLRRAATGPAHGHHRPAVAAGVSPGRGAGRPSSTQRIHLCHAGSGSENAHVPALAG